MKNDYTEQKQELMKEMVMGVTYVDAYLRYSSAAQNDGISIEMQTDEVERYCEKNGIVVRKWYIDRAQSASKKKAESRAAFYELIQDIKSGNTSGNLLIYSTSRAFRNSYESHKYRKFFREHGIKLMSVTQHIDEETSSGRLTTSILSDIDQYKAEELADYVLAAQRALILRGYWTGSGVPMGYKTVDVRDEQNKPRKKYAIDEETAPIVREVFADYLAGVSPRTIAQKLTMRGFKGKRGGKFSEYTVRSMLTNDFYIGTRRVTLKTYGEIVVEDAVEPIIDNATFAAVQKERELRKGKPQNKRKGTRTFALTGKVFCDCCNGHYIGDTNGGYTNKEGVTTIYHHYTCRNKRNFRTCKAKNIKKDVLEDYVLQEVKKHILNAEMINRIADETMVEMAKSASVEKDEDTLKKRRAEVIAELATLAIMKAKKEIDEEIYIISKKPFDDEKAQIDIDLHLLSHQKRNSVSREEIVSALEQLLADSESGNDELIKSVFAQTVESVHISEDKVIVNLVLSFNQSADKLRLVSPKYKLSDEKNRAETEI